MALSSKRTRLTEEALEKVHKLIDSHGGIVKKEEFADIDVDYRRILDFVESGELVRIKNGYYTDRMDRFSEEEIDLLWEHQQDRYYQTILMLLYNGVRVSELVDAINKI